MQTPKLLQNIKSRFLTTGLTTVGTVGLSGYLGTLAQSQGTQSAEATAITLLAGVFMASAPKLLDVILGVTSNIISSDLYDKFTKQEIYKQIPPEANLYLATYTAFQSSRNKDLQMIDEPFELTDEKIDALLASTIEKLCDELKIEIPVWIRKVPSCKEPFFVSGVENLKAILIVKSPLRFKVRNVFVSENFLVRV